MGLLVNAQSYQIVFFDLEGTSCIYAPVHLEGVYETGGLPRV